ncbi:hypothetical protein PTTG_26961 [Puccinia triticina 1-1 BBBD Race 1]|uniref:Uncharacterized protein n=1 Tax=Puccinia triticina (isolate 1-1 / race 1 (BBBD)) TaxID=630390 RepID=A0A180GPI3_PUCT1|nr:hypothetical protein PTTG_26961 [Puccinia triticina 1-1 BBBD Race 1]
MTIWPNPKVICQQPRRPALGPDNQVRLGDWRVQGGRSASPESDSTEDSRGNRVLHGRVVPREPDPYGADEAWPVDPHQEHEGLIPPLDEEPTVVKRRAPNTHQVEEIMDSISELATTVDEDGPGPNKRPHAHAAQEVPPQIPDRTAGPRQPAPPQAGRARRNAPVNQARRPTEYYVNGVRVAEGDPRRRIRPGMVRPTRGLTLEGFLSRCRICPTDYHTRAILRENRIVDWPFFLRSNEILLWDLGLSLGAARALCQGGLSLRRQAARSVAANAPQAASNQHS